MCAHQSVNQLRQCNSVGYLVRNSVYCFFKLEIESQNSKINCEFLFSDSFTMNINQNHDVSDKSKCE